MQLKAYFDQVIILNERIRQLCFTFKSLVLYIKDFAEWATDVLGSLPKCDNNMRFGPVSVLFNHYGKCPKNSNTKASDKMTYANSVDPDQTAPEGAV